MRFAVAAIALLLCGASVARAACLASDPTGYYEGTAQSKEAGSLKVSLNLRCDAGNYGGELVTPVGTFSINGGDYKGGHLTLQFGGGAIGDQGTIELDVAGTGASGSFRLGADSGSFAVERESDAQAPVSEAPTLALSAAQWHQDLGALLDILTSAHPKPYYHTPKAVLDGATSALDRRIPSLNADEMYVGLDHIANLIGDGHTYVEFPPDVALFGLVIQRLGADYRVVETLRGNESLLGLRVLAIDGTPIARVRDALYAAMTPVAETDLLRDIRAQNFLNLGIALHGTGVIRLRSAATYALIDDGGHRFTFRARALAPDDNSPWVWAWQRRPLYRQQPRNDFWFTYIAPSKTVYCSFRAYENLADNARALFAFVRAHAADKLVIDLRLNSGGDYKAGLQYLIDPIRRSPALNRRGHLFVLVGPSTFSAAMSNAAQFKMLTHAMLVGEPIGERPNSYQEANEKRLPNSRLLVRYSTRYYSFWPPGKPDQIVPDKSITPTWREFQAGDDPALDWILAQGVSAMLTPPSRSVR